MLYGQDDRQLLTDNHESSVLTIACKLLISSLTTERVSANGYPVPETDNDKRTANVQTLLNKILR